jgi:hypothetical protein
MSAARFLVGRAQVLSLVASLLFLCLPAFAQQPEGSQGTAGVPPDQAQRAPDISGQENDSKKDEKKQDDNVNPKNDRIFMVIPNYTTVEVPVAFKPLTAKEKFKLGAEDAFDPYAFPLAGILAGIAQAKNDDAAWGQGWKGFGKRYAAGYADTVSGSFMTTGVFPSMLHEDPRYFRKGTGGFRKRSLYALRRMFVITTDSGGATFNFSEYGGNAVAAGISQIYHSKEERGFSNFASDFGTQVLIDVVANQTKEFWPDIRHKLFKK